MSDIETYGEKIPKTLRMALNGISGADKIGYAIVMLLVEETRLTEQEIKKALLPDNDSIPKGRITELDNKIEQRIDDLQTGGVIHKHPGEKIGDPNTGTYDLTEFGKAILDGLYDASTPRNQETKQSNKNRNEVIDQRFTQSVANQQDTENEP